MVAFRVDGQPVSVEADPAAPISLLDALRDDLGVRSVKDGCSPQGQCGCCTVLVDGKPRVACVTPVTRVAERDVTTIDGLDDADGWAACFARHGATQCGFCTPGIIVRAAALGDAQRADRAQIERALLAHLCRCTGWQPIVEAIADGPYDGSPDDPDDPDQSAAAPTVTGDADESAAAPTVSGDAAVGDGAAGDDVSSERVDASTALAARRAALEGGTAQTVGPHVARGAGGFADDTAPSGALVAVLGPDGDWVVGESVADAHRRAGKVQGRRSTAPIAWPVPVADGEWDRVLQTTWVEPGYLEPDAAWCHPGGTPASPLGNAGAFGGKEMAEVAEVARRLADEQQRPVRVLYAREDVVRRGPKRPPVAIGLRADGSGIVRLGHSGGEDPQRAVDAVRSGIEAARLDASAVTVETIEIAGPPTSAALRAAGWAEIAVAAASLRDDGADHVIAPNGARASAHLDDDGLHIEIACGQPLDETVLRSYCTGAAHMALGWVRSEALALDTSGVPVDLTIRSFGILRAADMVPVHLSVIDNGAEPMGGSDAVFAAVAAAAWRAAGFPAAWPVDA